MKVVAQHGTPLPAEHLISSVNFKVEVQGNRIWGHIPPPCNAKTRITTARIKSNFVVTPHTHQDR